MAREKLRQSARMRVVVDANVLIAGLVSGEKRRRGSARIVRLIESGRLELCMTEDLLAEIRFKAQSILTEEQQSKLEQILGAATDVTDWPMEGKIDQVIADGADTKYYRAQRQAKAAHLVSRDADLLEDPERQRYNVVGPWGFLHQLGWGN